MIMTIIWICKVPILLDDYDHYLNLQGANTTQWLWPLSQSARCRYCSMIMTIIWICKVPILLDDHYLILIRAIVSDVTQMCVWHQCLLLYKQPLLLVMSLRCVWHQCLLLYKQPPLLVMSLRCVYDISVFNWSQCCVTCWWLILLHLI